MILSAIAFAAALATQPLHAQPVQAQHTHATASTKAPATAANATKAVPLMQHHASEMRLHSMTEEERKAYPGRDRFDKTEWYESCFKSSKAVIAPEHVDEWKNGGIEVG